MSANKTNGATATTGLRYNQASEICARLTPRSSAIFPMAPMIFWSAAAVATRIIQNIGAAFGSAILATVVSNALTGEAATVVNMVGAYHAGFITSLIFMVIGILPALFLTNKLRNAYNPINNGKE